MERVTCLSDYSRVICMYDSKDLLKMGFEQITLVVPCVVILIANFQVNNDRLKSE